MPAEDSSGARPPPVVLRIKLRYDDVETMVQRFAPNVGKSGLFLPTKSLQPVGTEIKFELRIADDTPVLVGLGRVRAAKAPDPANPKAAFGLAIELMRVTRDGREIIIRMIERRRLMGLPDVTIPMPDDLEASKRSDVETQPRAEVAAIVAPVAKQKDSEPILAAPPPIAGPGVTATPRDTNLGLSTREPRPERPSDSLLTAPRAAVGVVGAAKRDRASTPALAPEPVRAKRPRLADVIAKAEQSGPLAAAAIPELDEHVDVARALVRARALAGASDLDEELAALRESSAAPLAEISIEAASAELARQLGGKPISRRMRGASVPTALGTVEVTTIPPPVATAIGTAEVEAPVAEIEPPREYSRPVTSSSEMDQLAAEAAAGIAATRGEGVVAVERVDEPPAVIEPALPEPVPQVIELRAATAPPAQIVEDDPEVLSFGRALDAARVHTGVATPVAPGPDEDIAELEPDDIEELAETTQVGAHPDPTLGLAPPVEQLAETLDRQLDEAEANDDELEQSIHQAATAYEAELAQVPEQQVDDEFGEEEISDLDVLAEADADDADLLGANAERDSQDAAPAYIPAEQYSHDHPAASELAAEEPSTYVAADPSMFAEPETHVAPEQAAYDPGYAADAEYAEQVARERQVASATRVPRRAATPDDDFAARLDLDDETSPPPPFPGGYDIPSEYTIAEKLTNRPPSFAEQNFPETPGLDEALEFDEPHQFATNTPAPPQPRSPAGTRPRPPSHSRLASRATSPRQDPPADYDSDDSIDFDEPHGFVAPPAPDAPLDDLESALSTLDVDLDHLEVPQPPRTRHPRAQRESGRGSRPLPGMPPERTALEPPTVRPAGKDEDSRPVSRNVVAKPAPKPVAKRPVVPTKKPRAVSEDDGVLIDFDDDE